MRLPKFEYLAPKTIGEACSLLSRYKEKAGAIAGGTDLLPRIRSKQVAPQYLIGLKGIPNLNYVEHDEAQGLRIGTLTTLDVLETCAPIQSRFGIIAQAIQQTASLQIQSLATIGGNLCQAAPSADITPCLIALGARLKLISPAGERIVPLEEFFTGSYKTVLGDGELLVEIQVPNPRAHSGGVYIKHALHRAIDFAVVGVAAMITLKSNVGVCQEVKIALGAVAPAPIRARKAESILKGKDLKDGLIDKAAQAAAEEAQPISDIRSSAEYRREMVKVLTRRAMSQAWEKAKSV